MALLCAGQSAAGNGDAATTAPGPVVVESVVLRLLEEAEVPAQEGGVVLEVPAREGQRVKQGELLAQIDDEVARNVRQGGRVTVRRASLSSYLMSVEAGGPAIRVRRVQ